MLRNLLYALAILSIGNVSAQIKATTEDGKDVILNNDGTWKYSILKNTSVEKSYVFIGTDRLKAGKREYVKSDMLGISTSIQLAKKDNRVMIIFWQSQSSTFYYSLWEDEVFLYLEDGTAIKLLDRKMKGINRVQGSLSEERYSAHYLTEKECEMLEKSGISQISYFANGGHDRGRQILNVTENEDTCKIQLLELK